MEHGLVRPSGRADEQQKQKTWPHVPPARRRAPHRPRHIGTYCRVAWRQWRQTEPRRTRSAGFVWGPRAPGGSPSFAWPGAHDQIDRPKYERSLLLYIYVCVPNEPAGRLPASTPIGQGTCCSGVHQTTWNIECTSRCGVATCSYLKLLHVYSASLTA
jgi:hypothetical protein